MSMSWSRQEHVDERRLKVSRMRARGFSAREIAAELSRPVDEGGLVNPDTSLPYSFQTIGADFVYLDEQYRAEAAKETSAYKGKVLLELEEVKRFGWSLGTAKGADLVLKAIGRQCLILGLHEQVAINNFVNINVAELSEQQLEALVNGADPGTLLGDPALVLGQPAQVVEGESVRISSGSTGETSVVHDSTWEKSPDDSDDVSQE